MPMHKDDFGQKIILQVREGNTAPDLSAVATKEIILKAPDGTVSTKTAAFETDGTDGVISYTILTGEINAEGTWTVQGNFVFTGGWSGRSTKQSFEVLEKVE